MTFASVLGGIPTQKGNEGNITNKDLNLVTKPGLYYSLGSQSWTHGPTTSVNTMVKMIVLNSGASSDYNEIFQIIFCLNTSAQEIFYRTFQVGSTEDTWYKV